MAGIGMKVFFNGLLIRLMYNRESKRELLTSLQELEYFDNQHAEFYQQKHRFNPNHNPPFDEALLPYLLFRLTPCRKVFHWIATRAQYSFIKPLNVGQL